MTGTKIEMSTQKKSSHPDVTPSPRCDVAFEKLESIVSNVLSHLEDADDALEWPLGEHRKALEDMLSVIGWLEGQSYGIRLQLRQQEDPTPLEIKTAAREFCRLIENLPTIPWNNEHDEVLGRMIVVLCGVQKCMRIDPSRTRTAVGESIRHVISRIIDTDVAANALLAYKETGDEKMEEVKDVLDSLTEAFSLMAEALSTLRESIEAVDVLLYVGVECKRRSYCVADGEDDETSMVRTFEDVVQVTAEVTALLNKSSMPRVQQLGAFIRGATNDFLNRKRTDEMLRTYHNARTGHTLAEMCVQLTALSSLQMRAEDVAAPDAADVRPMSSPVLAAKEALQKVRWYCRNELDAERFPWAADLAAKVDALYRELPERRED